MLCFFIFKTLFVLCYFILEFHKMLLKLLGGTAGGFATYIIGNYILGKILSSHLASRFPYIYYHCFILKILFLFGVSYPTRNQLENRD